MIKQIIISIIISITFIISCQKYSNTNKSQYLYFDGQKNKEALLSKVLISKSGQKNLVPLERVFTNTKIVLPAGHYLLSNECSSYEFTQEAAKPKRISLSHLELNLLGDSSSKEKEQDEIHDDNQVVQSLCYNILNQKEYSYKNRLQFDILPGKNNIFISGKNLNFDFKPESAENLSLDLISLSLLSTHIDRESPHFFVVSQSEVKKVVISAPINGKIWLFPGKYAVEVNGTKKIIDLKTKIFQPIQLGMLKLVAPINFPFEKRVQLGGQPISAFIENKVLIRLNTSYPVFAGKYRINLEGSELEKEVEVKENKITVVNTLGAQIDAPPCSLKIATCHVPSKITIHENKQPFILMVVPVGLPFLVFAENNYQYGVEGVKGIFKSLPTSSSSVKTETLGLVHIKWEIRYSSSFNSTDFVRFESKSSNLYGKSVDMSFFKPTQVYLPEGDYWLTYFVGDAISQIAQKSRTEVNLSTRGSKAITVPLYVHGLKSPQKDSESNVISSRGSSVLAPIKK